MPPKAFSAGVVLVRRVGDERRYLLLRAYNYWDFPKGLVEPGEDPLRAARRELQEETGVTDIDSPWGEGFCETKPYGRGKVARYYLALAHSNGVRLPLSPELGRPEHHEFRWVDCREGMELLSPRLRPVLEWAHRVSELAA
jgi:bis(5'-nucleosidyl)-tetraphosphatase